LTDASLLTEPDRVLDYPGGSAAVETGGHRPNELISDLLVGALRRFAEASRSQPMGKPWRCVGL
jgi:hypothetical protein